MFLTTSCLFVVNQLLTVWEIWEIFRRLRPRSPITPHPVQTCLATSSVCLDVCVSICLSVCQVHWYHNDRLLRPSRRHEMKLTRDGVCSLRISDVTPDDAGTSVCLSVSLSVCLSVCLCLVVCLSVCLVVCLSCLSLCLSACLCMSECLCHCRSLPVHGYKCSRPVIQSSTSGCRAC